MNMGRRLSPAKPPLPKFQSDRQAADYFENHSVAGVWDQLPEAPLAKPSPALAEKIRGRQASGLQLHDPPGLRERGSGDPGNDRPPA